MSAKPAKARFGYLAAPSITPTPQEDSQAALVPESQSSPKVQFNIRVSQDVKRRAMSRAALEGRHVSDVIEELLEAWLNEKRES